MISNILIAVVAALHLYFMYLEMVAWDQPLGRKVFRTTAEFATASKALAANQGLYNGFLVAGLAWGLYLGEAGFGVKVFFLACVIVAGLFGAATVSRRILYAQALPAAVGADWAVGGLVTGQPTSPRIRAWRDLHASTPSSSGLSRGSAIGRSVTTNIDTAGGSKPFQDPATSADPRDKPEDDAGAGLPVAHLLSSYAIVLPTRGRVSYRSVNFSSMRRFLTRASSVSAASSGWNSPNPAATSRLAGTPFSIRNFTTEVARADESSQLSR